MQPADARARRDATPRLRAAAQLEAIDGLDTDRTVMSDGGDAWTSLVSHPPVKLRPQGVPAINMASLRQRDAASF